MLGRSADFIQAVLNLIVIADIFHGDIRHPHNSVNRRTDIVAHMGQEITLGLTRAPRLFRRIF